MRLAFGSCISALLLISALAPGADASSDAHTDPADGDVWIDAQAVPDVPPVERMRPLRTLADFDQGIDGWRSGHAENNESCPIELVHAPGEGVNGSGALRVDYHFSGRQSLEYIDFRTDLPLPNPGEGLVLRIRQPTDAPGLIFRLRIRDASGEIHQPDIAYSREGDWLAGAVTFVGGHSWGGDGNHRLDYPCALASIVFDRPSAGYAGDGSVFIDDVIVAQPVSVAPDITVQQAGAPLGKVYRPGDRLRLRLAPGEAMSTWRLEDLWSTVSARGTWTAGDVGIDQVLHHVGWFQVVVERRGDDGRLARMRVPFAVLPKPEKENTQVGFSVHFGQWWPLSAMDLLHRYGVTSYRDEIAWQSVERQSGVYAMPESARRFLDHGKHLGMDPLIIFDYGNPHYDGGNYPNSPEAIAGFAAYCAWLAAATAGTVQHFEVWNEWTGGCGMAGKTGDHTPEAYAKLLQAVFPAVRAVRPEATIVGVGGEYVKPVAENVARVGRAGAGTSMDAFSIHPYVYPQMPEAAHLGGKVQEVVDAATAVGMPGKVWVTEIGHHTALVGTGATLHQQARTIVRTLATLASVPAMQRVFWYDFLDDGMDDGYHEFRFGVVHHPNHGMSPKPAAVAFAVYHQQTADAVANQLTVADNGVRTMSWSRSDGSELRLVWTVSGTAALTLDRRPQAIIDLMGAKRSVAGLTLTLSEDPLYVVLPK